ncbi:hypothetical protein [Halosegnis marinus]|uniref:Uncharacterized protein n=1 Tax=Halosegnis marinus TaxID=3034023 RepID=A0ABD5ZQJ7_9EURY|nr:hypothetical protein [Halosegnis sp. DT85]
MDEELGTATIVYETPDGTVEKRVENEHLAYFQDHWILKAEEHEEGDVVRRIPRERVHYVERPVGEFREEVATLRNQVESFAEDIRERVLGGERRAGEEADDEPTRIDVGSGEDEDTR